MKESEMYLGFDPKKQAQYEKEIIERGGETAKAHVEESHRRTKDWTKSDFEKAKKDCDELHRAFAEAIERGISPNSNEVQVLVKRHYGVVKRFWTPNRVSYIGLGDSYCGHSDFRKMYDDIHPKLAEYLAEAMKVFAECELK